MCCSAGVYSSLQRLCRPTHAQIQDDYNWWGQLPGDSYRYIEANAEHSQVCKAPGEAGG